MRIQTQVTPLSREARRASLWRGWVVGGAGLLSVPLCLLQMQRRLVAANPRSSSCSLELSPHFLVGLGVVLLPGSRGHLPWLSALARSSSTGFPWSHCGLLSPVLPGAVISGMAGIPGARNTVRPVEHVLVTKEQVCKTSVSNSLLPGLAFLGLGSARHVPGPLNSSALITTM